MSFLRINGWAVPVKDVSVEIKEIGSRGTSHAGSPLSDIRNTKRIIKGKTTPMTELQAEAFKGAIMGLGDNWIFNNNDYSDKGIDTTSTNGYGYISLTAVDGDPTVIHSTSGYHGTARNGSYLLSTTGVDYKNVLSANTSNAEGTTSDYAVTGGGSATLSMDTTHKFAGSQSLKVDVTTGGGYTGVRTPYVAVAGSKKVSASAYVKAYQNMTLRVYLDGDVTGTGTTSDLSLVTDTWYLIHFEQMTSDSGGENFAMFFVTNQPDDFYIDNLQIAETNTIYHNGIFPWVIGGTTVTGDSSGMRYNFNYPGGHNGLTISWWTPQIDIGLVVGTTTGKILEVSDSTEENIFQITATWGTYDFYSKNIVDSTSYNTTYLASTSTQGSTHYTVAYRFNFETGEKAVYFYENGTLLGSEDSSQLHPAMTDMTELIIGNSTTKRQVMDCLTITPYAMTSGQISAIYNMGKQLPTFPSFYVDGDIIPDDQLTTLFQGRVTGINYIQAISTVWRTNLQEVEFELIEV